MKKIILILMLTAFLHSLFAVEMNETYFKFQITSKTELNKLTRIISIDNVKGNTVFAYANSKEMAKFKSLGYPYTKLENPGLTLKNPKMAFTKDGMRDWDSYPTYETYVNMMYGFASEYPNICHVESMGQSVEGRELLFAKISDNVNVNEDEPAFFYTAQMHGDEIVTYIMMLHLIDHLCSNYGSDTEVTNLVNNMQIWINPLSNPDGTYHGGNDTVSGAQRYNGNGIDLNRNFPDPEDGDHPDGNPYQPENIIMMNFAEEHHIVMGANFHSGAEVVNYPWDTWPTLHADDDWWQMVSHEYADTVHDNAPTSYMDEFNNGITNGYAWYTTSGCRQDYMNYFRNCREVTIELSNDKMLPANQLINHWNYNRDSFILYIKEALYGFSGHVTDNAGNPISAEITVQNHDNNNSQVYSDDTFGAYYRPIKAGTYDIVVSKDGYIPQLFDDVTITDYATVTLDATLSPAAYVDISGTVTDGDSGDPISNVELTLLNTSIDPVYADQNGHYTITNVEEGLYQISLSATGYAMLVEDINVSQSNTEFNFDMFISNAESFEAGIFGNDWTFSGNADWLITSDYAYDGSKSTISGNIDDGEHSALIFTSYFETNGVISFYYQISSETNYDFLHFYIDDVEMGSWSGEANWTQVSYNITAGEHVLKWDYEKDSSVSSGNDSGWIDYVEMPPHHTAGEAHLVYNPTSFDVNMPMNQTRLDTLYLGNDGTEDLSYEIGIQEAGKSSTPRSISGSYMECSPSSFNTGTITELTFTVHCSSSDEEWMKNVTLNFPTEFSVVANSVSDLTGGSGGDFSVNVYTNSIVWGQTGNSYLEDGDVAQATLQINPLPIYQDDAILQYTLSGDNWGSDPHSVSDEITLINNGPLVTWLTLNSSNGLIAPGGENPIILTFDTTNMDIGQYSCNIIISDNTSEAEHIIPVHLTVLQASTDNETIPVSGLSLSNYPNPFNPETTIAFNLPTGDVKESSIEIYNLKGEKVKVLEVKNEKSGMNKVVWNGKNNYGKKVSSGIYMYRLKQDNKTIATKKMILMK